MLFSNGKGSFARGRVILKVAEMVFEGLQQGE